MTRNEQHYNLIIVTIGIKDKKLDDTTTVASTVNDFLD
jgi:hypothetical protein